MLTRNSIALTRLRPSHAGAAPLWWEQYQFNWMSVHPECNVPAKCSVTGRDTKEILLLGDSMQRLFLETICQTLGGHSELHASRHYDVPSNCSIDGESHITHQHLLGMSPQPPYFDSNHHDGGNATTRFHNIMHALPRRPDVVGIGLSPLGPVKAHHAYQSNSHHRRTTSLPHTDSPTRVCDRSGKLYETD